MYKIRYDQEWNFKEGKMNELNHLMHPYPAMLMPLIVRQLLQTYGNGMNTVILDPYVGSGTTLIESQLYGAKSVYGVDLNPLAILISRAKTQKYNLDKLKLEIDRFAIYLNNIDYSLDIEDSNIHNFALRNSWFKPMNVLELDYIKKYFSQIDDEKIKLFFIIAFSQTVRTVSMTRNGEFKLYRIPKEKIDAHNVSAINDILSVLKKNFSMIEKVNGKLNYETDVQLYEMNTIDMLNDKRFHNKFDMVITSPPYGDSHTTVAYGQFSRLANEWIGIPSANQIDSNLLGGKTKVDLDKKFDITELDDVIEKIKIFDKTQQNKRHPDVISFYIDYIKSIDAVANSVKTNGVVIYVVGNRRVRNYELPTDVVTIKAFERHGFEHIETIVRDILNKRMPSKASPDNRVGGQISTMMKEYIVIMKKVT